MCARRTRLTVELKVDAAALLFPVAVAGGLGAGRAADFPAHRSVMTRSGLDLGGWNVGRLSD